VTDHLPVLVVVVPLLAGPVAMLVRRPALAWAVAFAASAAAFGMAVLIAQRVAHAGTWSYALGGFAPPLGIEFRLDGASTLMLVVVTAISTVVLAGAHTGARREIAAERAHLFHAAWMLCLTGLLGIVATGDAFNLFVFLEISSLASYALVASGNDRRALTAAFQYLILGTIGAGFYLIGVAALYAVTGTLNMLDLATRLAPMMDLRVVKMGFAFMVVGLSLKVALFPLHLWLPGAYAYAPSPVSAFLAGTATKVAGYALLRVVFGVFGLQFAFGVMAIGPLLLALALAAVFVASTVAIYQHDVKRMLAYSSIAQIGYIVLGASYGTTEGLAAGLLHLFNHALIKTTLFLAVGCVVFRGLRPTLVDLRGIARHMPWTAGAAAIAGLSLIGIPLTAGFTGKWQLASTALAAGDWLVLAAIVGSSLLTVAYVWRLFEAALFGTPDTSRQPPREAPWALLVPLWLLALANLWFGVSTSLSLDLARRAALALTGGLP
jgi:multicomponent Na+:H+ antiporter subunit D